VGGGPAPLASDVPEERDSLLTKTNNQSPCCRNQKKRPNKITEYIHYSTKWDVFNGVSFINIYGMFPWTNPSWVKQTEVQAATCARVVIDTVRIHLLCLLFSLQIPSVDGVIPTTSSSPALLWSVSSVYDCTNGDTGSDARLIFQFTASAAIHAAATARITCQKASAANPWQNRIMPIALCAKPVL